MRAEPSLRRRLKVSLDPPRERMRCNPRSAALLLLHSATSPAAATAARQSPTSAMYVGKRARAAAASLAFASPPSNFSSSSSSSACSSSRFGTVASPALLGARASVPMTSTRVASRSSAAATACAAALVGGAAAATIASCSAVENETGDEPEKNGSATTNVVAQRSIDLPPAEPEHDPALPFPPSSLRHDTYNGVTVDVSKLPTSTLSGILSNPTTFAIMLRKALDIWKAEGRKGIWIRVPTEHSALIPPSTELGFDFQHAEPGQLVLTKWLPTETESRLPHGPTHQVGVGALVLHPHTGKMLAVQERTGPAAARKLWKMPTGLTDPGEDIAHAAVRELREETGLDCVFDRIVCFRQAHGGLFNRSDMFFVCLCRLAPHYEDTLREEGGDIELKPQEEEIASVEWIDMEDYAEQEVWQQSPLYREMNGAMLQAAREGVEYADGGGDVTETETAGDDDTGVTAKPLVRGEDRPSVPSGGFSGASSQGGAGGFIAKTLPVGFRPGANTIYISKL